jgi:hypothetical protein
VWAMTRCTFADCPAPAVAKGLCAKHYMRLRRHGDPAKVNARGRRDGDAAARKAMSQLSDRTYARFQRGLRLLRLFELDAAPVIAKCTRPNGSINCAMFERVAEGMAAMTLAKRDAISTLPLAITVEPQANERGERERVSSM